MESNYRVELSRSIAIKCKSPGRVSVAQSCKPLYTPTRIKFSNTFVALACASSPHAGALLSLPVRGGRRLMKFEYTGRHVEVSPALRRHVEDHFKKLDHIFNSDSSLTTHVIIDVEKNRQIGEIVVNWREHTLTAKDTNADMYMALTRAMAKIEKQA